MPITITEIKQTVYSYTMDTDLGQRLMALSSPVFYDGSQSVEVKEIFTDTWGFSLETKDIVSIEITKDEQDKLVSIHICMADGSLVNVEPNWFIDKVSSLP